MSGLEESLTALIDVTTQAAGSLVTILEAIPSILADGVESLVNSTVLTTVLSALFGGLGLLAVGLASVAGYLEDFLNIMDANSIVSAVEETISLTWDAFLDLIS